MLVIQGGNTPTVSLSSALTKLAEAHANGGATTSFAADAPGSARVTISPTGEIRFSISDSAGRGVMSGILDSSNQLVTWNCTVHDETITIDDRTYAVSHSVDALGRQRKSYTDGLGRTFRNVDALGKETLFTHDLSGNQLSVRDPSGVSQDCIYDELGRQISCTDTVGSTTSSTYDTAGNRITATDAKNKTTSYIFDVRGRQTKITDRLSGETEFAYTARGQLASLTDAENQTTSYTYSTLGQKLTETYPDHVGGNPGDAGYGIVTFTYDPAGRVQTKHDQRDTTVTFNYDLAGRLTSRAYSRPVSAPDGPINPAVDTDNFTYDDSGRMLTAISGRYINTVAYSYDSAGRKSTESLTTDGQTYTTGIAYDSAGQLSQYTYPDGTIVERTYTERGQLFENKFAGVTIDTRTYDDSGRMTQSVYSNGVTTNRAYNNDNTLASITHTGSPIGNYTYTWDANKNKLTESITGVMSNYGFAAPVTYDDEDRLTSWSTTDNSTTRNWNLSLVGDWNSVTKNGVVENRTHGPAHELSSTHVPGVNNGNPMLITHDPAGNMTSLPVEDNGMWKQISLTWDPDNRMQSADSDNDGTDDVFYYFDALGRRIKRTSTSESIVYVQVGKQTIADYVVAAAPASPKYRYLWASYVDEPVLRAAANSADNIYYHRNQQYSVVANTNPTG
ncbi:MAG: hypothetical protein AAFP90_17070, partial [Planctomycetota bacterium]